MRTFTTIKGHRLELDGCQVKVTPGITSADGKADRESIWTEMGEGEARERYKQVMKHLYSLTVPKTSKRPKGVFTKGNEYQKVLSAEFYRRCPKSVLAAIAVSYAARQFDEDFTMAENAIIDEWKALYTNGIVPQKP